MSNSNLFGKDVKETPLKKFFQAEIKDKDGEYIEVNAEELRKAIAEVVAKHGGIITFEELVKRLKEMGLVGDQYEERKKIEKIFAEYFEKK